MATYSKEFKEEAIRLSDEIGNKKAAAQLGIPYYTLADWRNHSKHKPKETVTMSEDELRIRNRELAFTIIVATAAILLERIQIFFITKAVSLYRVKLGFDLLKPFGNRTL